MRDNFLFIVADDLNAWIGALGRNPDVRTPNIDALARRGTLFVNAFCSAPYCNASRMGVFTGCLPGTTGIYQNEPFWEAPLRKATFVELLRESGYHTFGAGKVFHGMFDYAAAGAEGRTDAQWRELENRPFLWNGFQANHSDPLPDSRPLNGLFDFSHFETVPPAYHHFDWGPLPADREEDMPDSAVLRACRLFLENAPPEPFFCAAGFYKPHLPWHVPQRFFDLYDPARISLPLVKDDDLEDVPPIGRTWALSPPDHELVTSRGQWPQAVQGYLAAISYVDELIGELVAALDRSGLAENTTVVLWGDNGFHLGEKLHWRKFVLWEEATRVPLIVASPGRPETRRRVYEPVSLIDICPTIAELAGVAALPADGCSLIPLMSGEASHRPRPVIMTWGRGNHSMRLPQWRYTRYVDGTEELYDHAADPFEWTNLASEPTFQDVKMQCVEAITPYAPS
jgi:arylsulfatase A-like enzyme